MVSAPASSRPAQLNKTGEKLYVEINDVVAPGTWDVADIDRLRRDVLAGLAADDITVRLNVDLTCEGSPPGDGPGGSRD